MLTCVAGKGSKGLNDAGRAATVIHEATHQLSKTGDDINKSGNIIKPYDGKSQPSGATGCACPQNLATNIESSAHLNLGSQIRKIITYTRLSPRSRQTPVLLVPEIRQITCTTMQSPTRE